MEYLDLVPRVQKLTIAEMETYDRAAYYERLRRSFDLIPPLYAQDGKRGQAVVYLRYFAPCHFLYFTELDKKTGKAFGWSSEDEQLGYTSLPLLIQSPLVELDFYFEPKTLENLKCLTR